MVLQVDLTRRPRRNRKSEAIRSLVCETQLTASNLVQPYFVIEGEHHSEPVHSMPGVSRLTVDRVVEDVKLLYGLGVGAIILFPVIAAEDKNMSGSAALDPQGLMCVAIRAIKLAVPEMAIIADVALDPYTSHGHDGVVDAEGNVLNDESVAVLGEMSVVLADAGADIIAPSDMMDGRIGHIRSVLDASGHHMVSIMSYTVKYTSAFYGPFRDALDSAPRFGDKKTYQLNPANVKEALLEAELDELEGADFLMCKPALSYLDVIAKMKAATHLPLAAFHVSGEYAMIMAAAQNGWIDGDRAMDEALISIKRAGADIIISYAAKTVAQRLSS